jgi:hypothetical protein
MHQSILAEEPRGLLACTALAYDSQPDPERPGIYSFIERFKGSHPTESAVRQRIEHLYDIDEMVCYFDRVRRFGWGITEPQEPKKQILR